MVVADIGERNWNSTEEVYHVLWSAFHRSCIEVGMADMIAHIER